MSSENEHETPGNATSPQVATVTTPLASRFQQMFPILSGAEIDRVRRFGEIKQFTAGELLFHAGEAVPGPPRRRSSAAIMPRNTTAICSG